MHLEGSFQTSVARATVWEFLLNPNDIAPCIPDLQSVEVTGPDSFKAKVKIGLSVVRGNMDFDFQIADKVPPSSAKLVGKGRGVGSTVDLQTSFVLDESSSGTKVGWAAEVTVGGVISGLGSKLLDSTSAKMVEQVVANFQTKLREKANH